MQRGGWTTAGSHVTQRVVCCELGCFVAKCRITVTIHMQYGLACARMAAALDPAFALQALRQLQGPPQAPPRPACRRACGEKKGPARCSRRVGACTLQLLEAAIGHTEVITR